MKDLRQVLNVCPVQLMIKSMCSQPYNQLTHVNIYFFTNLWAFISKQNFVLYVSKGYYSDISSTIGQILNSTSNHKIYHPSNTYQVPFTMLNVFACLISLNPHPGFKEGRV